MNAVVWLVGGCDDVANANGGQLEDARLTVVAPDQHARQVGREILRVDFDIAHHD